MDIAFVDTAVSVCHDDLNLVDITWNSGQGKSGLVAGHHIVHVPLIEVVVARNFKRRGAFIANQTRAADGGHGIRQNLNVHLTRLHRASIQIAGANKEGASTSQQLRACGPDDGAKCIGPLMIDKSWIR